MMAGMVAIGAAVRGAGGGWGWAGMMAGMVAMAMGGAGMTRLIERGERKAGTHSSTAHLL